MKFVIINQWAYFPRVQLRKVQLILLEKNVHWLDAGVFSYIQHLSCFSQHTCVVELVWSLGTSARIDRPHSHFW